MSELTKRLDRLEARHKEPARFVAVEFDDAGRLIPFGNAGAARPGDCPYPPIAITVEETSTRLAERGLIMFHVQYDAPGAVR